MPNPSWPRMAILAVLICASVALFWRRFGKVVGAIRLSRPDADFDIHPLSPRFR